MTDHLISLRLIVDNPYQPRTVDDAEHIEKLARSIAADGLLQKPAARNHGANGACELAFGHSRRKAFEWLRQNWKEQGLPDRYNGYTVMPVELTELSDEEMYRHAIAENVQRKDLAPTELAQALKRYMEEFNATSQKAAELFGMSDATVRGMVRLLDLPKPVQERLDDGTISQGTARLFLSMQKIAPEKEVIETLDRVVKNKSAELPEAVIEKSIRHLNNTVEMWDEGYERGKPRGGRNGWLLDMKNFPNHLLPAMTEQQVGAFEAQLEHLNDPPACNACPFYTKVRGSHFCGMKFCHQRKKAAWERLAVEQASKQTKIAVYTQEDGAYRVLSYDSASVAAFEKKHKGLRLMPKSAIGSYTYQHYTKLNDDLVVVVATGEDLLGRLAKGTGTSGRTRGGSKSEKEKAEMRAMKVYRPRRKELLWEFTACAKTMFDAAPHDVLKMIDSWQHIGVDVRPPEESVVPHNAKVDEAKTDYLRRLIVWRLCGGSDYGESLSRHDLRKISDRLEKLAKGWGVKYPASLKKMAEQFEAEVQAAKGVAVETLRHALSGSQHDAKAKAKGKKQ